LYFILNQRTEFLRRFCQHILPRRFVRIRYYGMLSTACRKQLGELQQVFGMKVMRVKKRNTGKKFAAITYTTILIYAPNVVRAT
jgi:hypothetical protein